MSYSAGNLKTEYIDPVSFTPNSRCRFELDGSKLGYLPNIRLLNLGCDNNDAAHSYSKGLGALALIKNCRILDGRTELSAIRNFAPYGFFKNLRRSNDINKSNDGYLKRNELGYEINGVNNKVDAIYNRGKSNTAASGLTDSAYVDMRDLLPLLNAVPILPTSVFRNLIVEIEFESNTANQVIYKTDGTVTILRPILAVDYIEDPRLMEPMMGMLMQGVNWREVEHDNYVIPAVALGTDIEQVQSTSNNSLGFIGKRMGNLLVSKQFVDKSKEVGTGGSANQVLGFGAVASSQAVLKEQVQVRLNGRAVFPGAGGVGGANAMLGTVVDAYGELQCSPGSNQYLWNQADTLNDDENQVGQSSFIACEVGARIADLQLTLSRTNNQDTNPRDATNAALVVNLYADIEKVIVFNGGQYSVIYA